MPHELNCECHGLAAAIVKGKNETADTLQVVTDSIDSKSPTAITGARCAWRQLSQRVTTVPFMPYGKMVRHVLWDETCNDSQVSLLV